MHTDWLHTIYFAQSYGEGLYGRGLYSADRAQSTELPVIQIGPITLPVTGVGLLAIKVALVLAVAAYLFFAYRQHKANNKPITVSILLVPALLLALFIAVARIG